MSETMNNIAITEIRSECEEMLFFYTKGHIDKSNFFLEVEKYCEDQVLHYDNMSLERVRHTWLRMNACQSDIFQVYCDIPEIIPQPGAFKATVLFILAGIFLPVDCLGV